MCNGLTSCDHQQSISFEGQSYRMTCFLFLLLALCGLVLCVKGQIPSLAPTYVPTIPTDCSSLASNCGDCHQVCCAYTTTYHHGKPKTSCTSHAEWCQAEHLCRCPGDYCMNYCTASINNSGYCSAKQAQIGMIIGFVFLGVFSCCAIMCGYYRRYMRPQSVVPGMPFSNTNVEMQQLPASIPISYPQPQQQYPEQQQQQMYPYPSTGYATNSTPMYAGVPGSQYPTGQYTNGQYSSMQFQQQQQQQPIQGY